MSCHVVGVTMGGASHRGNSRKTKETNGVRRKQIIDRLQIENDEFLNFSGIMVSKSFDN
jgi:hypothetical protein